MRNAKYPLLAVSFLAAGVLLGAQNSDQSAPRHYGYGNALTKKDWTALLIQILPKEKNDREYAVNAKVLADIHGKITEGATIRITADFAPFAGSAESNFPNSGEGDIQVWPVQEEGPGKYKYRDVQGDFPFGVDAETPIAPSDIDKVKAAFKELGSALEAPDHAAPTRARIDELLKEKNFYLWAMGAWCLARDADATDEKLLKKLAANPDLSLAQAMWLHNILMLQLGDAGAKASLSIDEINTQLFSFLSAYVKRQPGPPDTVAPAPSPPRPSKP